MTAIGIIGVIIGVILQFAMTFHMWLNPFWLIVLHWAFIDGFISAFYSAFY